MAAYDVTTANSALEFDTAEGNSNKCIKLDDTHFINCFRTGGGLRCQVFAVNTSTFAVTTAGAKSNEFDTIAANQQMSGCMIDANHFILVWADESSASSTEIFVVNTSTFAITTAGTKFDFYAGESGFNSCYKIDTNHIVNVQYEGGSLDGYATVFAINTSTWAITTASTPFKFETGQAQHNSCYQIDATHFINFWGDSADKGESAIVMVVNTTTWAVTTAGDKFPLTATQYKGQYNSCAQIDSNHFINFFVSADDDGYVGVVTVNTSTWAITTASSLLEFDTDVDTYNSCFIVDSTHFINFWNSTSTHSQVQVFTVNASTYAISTTGNRLEFDTNANFYGAYNSCYKVDTNHFINFWQGTDNDGFVQVFAVEGAAAGPTNLKTLNTNAKANIKSINTNLIANVKTYNTQT